MLFYNTCHVFKTAITQFECIGIEYFAEFMVLWEVFLDQFDKCLADVSFDILAKGWVEPNNFAISVSITFDFIEDDFIIRLTSSFDYF